MKLIATVSFILSLLLIIDTAFAQGLIYSIYADLNEGGESSVKLTITFPRAEDSLNFTIRGVVKEFNATSNAGPVYCDLKTDIITFVDCKLNLTQEKRTVYIDYKTMDFVKISGNRYYFDGDFTINQNITQLSTSIKLPEGFIPVKEGIFPKDATAEWDIRGRRLTVFWSLEHIKSNQMIRFQLLSEFPQPQLQLWHFILVGSIIACISAFFVFRYTKKHEKLVLSVLDEFERKVLDVVIKHDGVVKQKRVVQETNLSKAKVSRVVKSLAERGLIKVERIGRTNRLKLVKKKLGF